VLLRYGVHIAVSTPKHVLPSSPLSPKPAGVVQVSRFWVLVTNHSCNMMQPNWFPTVCCLVWAVLFSASQCKAAQGRDLGVHTCHTAVLLGKRVVACVHL
jgi:hypothetical protein